MTTEMGQFETVQLCMLLGLCVLEGWSETYDQVLRDDNLDRFK